MFKRRIKSGSGEALNRLNRFNRFRRCSAGSEPVQPVQEVLKSDLWGVQESGSGGVQGCSGPVQGPVHAPCVRFGAGSAVPLPTPIINVKFSKITA